MIPPPLPGKADQAFEQRLKAAAAANVFLPGAGVFMLGHRKAGGILAGLFLLCFLGVLGLFVVGYANYFSAALDENILKDNRLESIGQGFHQGWMLALGGAGVLIYAIATIAFNKLKKSSSGIKRH